MTAQELKERLSDEDIKTLLEIMGAVISYEDDDYWISDTICHCGKKQKLYYYKDSGMFYCYTECGQMDIITLVMQYKDFKEDEFYKAINWICIQLNFDNCEYGFGKPDEKDIISDWEFIKNYKKSKKSSLRKHQEKELPIYDETVLNLFQDIYPENWIDEGISISSMKKYEIKYCMWQHRIILPHRNIKNDLIGVRSRATIDEEIERFGKYSPFKNGETFYNHSLGLNLYGLNFNINAIQKKRKIMLVEAEKSVLQSDSMFGEDSFTVSLCGCNLTDYQKGIILMLGVREVIVALDKQYETVDSEECKKWAKHIKENIIDKLSPYVTVTVLWDVKGLLPYKASPTDMGKDVLLELMDNKIYVSTNE